MSWPVAARIARRELRGGLSGFGVFLACLAFGVAAIAAVGIVRASIEAGLAREGAALLGGDAEIELTYRFATPEERAWMESVSEAVSEVVDFRSMAVLGEARALTQVKGVDGAYPLLGSVELAPEMPLSQALDGTGGVSGAVMDRVLADRLGLAPGDRFRLGTGEFVLSALLEREPDRSTGITLGPRTIVRRTALEGSGLLSDGSLYETQYRLLLSKGTDLAALEAEAGQALDGSGMRWRDSRNGAPGIKRFVERLGAFLVLVGLSGLAVGGVGIAASVRAYIDRKIAVIAVLKTLGASRATVFQTYVLQVGALTVLGILLGLAMGAALPMLAAPLIEAQLPVPAVFAPWPGPLLEAALYGVLSAALFTIWPLARTESVRAAALFRDAGLRPGGWPRPVWIFVTGLVLAVLVAAAAELSGVARLTFWTAGGLTGAFVALLLAAAGLRRAARALARRMRGRAMLRLALGAIGGPGSETGAVVLSLGLGLTVLAAIGQIDATLKGAIARDLPEVAPSYFVVDIQGDQLDGFRAMLAARPSVSRVETAPMLRGVITKINGRPAEEVAGPHWVLRGDRGMTYSAAPPTGTVVTAGKWWPEDYSGPPLASFAAEEAEEIGLRLGDRLTINVLGRDIEAEIANFREVDFSNAGLGFVLSLDPGALAGAPHTHIATIYAAPADEAAILRDLAAAYPNITAIRVKDAIERVSEILAGIAAAITWGALATLVTGVIVLVGTAAAVERARTYEAALLKTLGAARGTILANFALRSALLGVAAGVVALVAGCAGAWAIARFVLETDYVFAPGSAALVIALGIGATLLSGLAFAWRPLAARPARVLRARE